MTTNTEALLRGASREDDAHDEAKADRYCDMGVGCGEYGACYAAANGEPERCSLATQPAPAASAEREARVIEQNARKAAQEQLYAERERHTAEVKRLQAEIGRLKAPAASVSDGQIDAHLDNILRAAGSALRHYTMQKSKDDMRAALRNAILALRPAQAGVPEGFPEFDQLEDEVIDAACAAGSIYRVDLMRAYECMRAMLAAAPTKDHP